MSNTSIEFLSAPEVIVPSTEEVTAIERVSGLDIYLSPNSERREFDINPATGKPVAVGYTKAKVNGLWHLSVNHIDQFTDRKMGRGSHGLATYIGGGAIGGDALRILRNRDHYAHELTLAGNVLLVAFPDLDDASYVIAEHAGVERSASMAPGKFLNRLLREHAVDGVRYDSFVLHGEVIEGSGQYMAEGVVLNPANNLYLQGVTYQPSP
ncbi:MAG TPA: hypothetical protein VFB59_03425 [Candidatus Saccharimonadales bacterium]|nr:hypothetical protein [Candidatus Saccharimonadales bacterium]